MAPKAFFTAAELKRRGWTDSMIQRIDPPDSGPSSSTDERRAYSVDKVYFVESVRPRDLKPKVLCPFCQERGSVYTKPAVRKLGISGSKAVGGLVTAGISLLVTGLSQTKNVTEARCGNCFSSWDF